MDDFILFTKQKCLVFFFDFITNLDKLKIQNKELLVLPDASNVCSEPAQALDEEPE
jgi:hypothetical protein